MSSDSTRRAVRTVLDLVPAVLASLVVLVGVFDLSAETVAKVGTVVGAITVLLAKVRNALEDGGYIPALLKAPASDGMDPLPDAGYSTVGLAVGVSLMAVGLVLVLTVSVTTGVAVAILGLLALLFL